MALQAEQAVAQWVITLLFEQGHRQKFALRFGHFAAGSIQVHNVHPVIAPVVANIAFRLRNFVRMVREGIVDAAAVDIEVLAQIFERNAGTFDVPARIANAPRRIPLERLIFKLGFCEPEHKVVLVALVRILLDALADADGEVFFLVIVENIVFFKLRCVKVYIAALNVGIACVEKLGNDLDILINAAGSWLNNVGLLDVQLAAVVKKSVSVELGNLHDSFMLAAGALEHLVFSLIRVGGQMADVCDVHDALHGIARVAEVFFQHILHDIAAQIANMRKVIDRRAAGIHFDQLRVIGDKFFLFVCGRVVKIHRQVSFFVSLICSSSSAMRRLSSSISSMTGSGVWIWSSLSPQSRTIRPGTPTTVAPSGTSRSTTAFAAMRALLPTRNGPSTFAPEPTMTLLPSVGWRLPTSLPVPPSVTP